MDEARIFISYAKEQFTIAGQLKGDLTQHHYSIWMDSDSIPGGELWKAAIIKGIEHSVVMIILVTSDAIKSQNVRDEIKIAHSFNKPIIPLIMDEFEDFVKILKILDLDQEQAIDFSSLGYDLGISKLLQALEYWIFPYQLAEELNHYSPLVRIRGVDTLISTTPVMKTRQVFFLVIDAINKELESQVKCKLIDALATFKFPEVVDLLIELLEIFLDESRPDKDNITISTIIHRLGSIGMDNPKAIKVMTAALKDRVIYIRQYAAEMLGKSSDESVKELGFSSLINLLYDPENRIGQLDVVSALGRFGDKRAIEHLIPFLTDKNEYMRPRAETALKELGYEE